jgi:hypothetical protein
MGDLNGDGKLDIVLLEEGQNLTSNYVDIFYGNGDGTFQPAQSFLTAYYPASVALGNFTGNGYLSIAVGDLHGVIEMYNNTGGKTFTPGNSITLPGTSNSVSTVRAGDIEDDGITDLAASMGSAAYVLWGDGKGDFTTVQLGTFPTQGYLGLSVTDVNQDGAQDILLWFDCGQAPPAGHGPGGFCTQSGVYYGQGNRTTFYRQAFLDTSNISNNFFAVDVNGDGIADLVGYVLTQGELNGIAVYFGHPDGSFDQTATTFVSTSNGDFTFAPGDFNRDGKIDLGGPGFVFLNATPTAPCATSQINPTVTVCAPVNNTYLPGTFQIEATTYDKNTVTALQEYIDGKLVYNQPVTTFNISQTEPVGGHLLVTKAWDASGVNFRSDRTINVFSGTPGYSCPAAPTSASICLPSGATASSPVHILGNASSAAVPTAVQLYIDNSLVIDNTTGGTTAIDTTQTLDAGSHYLVFKMFDASGASYMATKTITVQ